MAKHKEQCLSIMIGHRITPATCLAIIFASILGSAYYLAAKIGSQTDTLRWITADRQITHTARALHAAGMAHVARELCATAEPSPLCEALARRTYDNIGDHNDLWIAFDSILSVLHGAELTKPLRRELTRYTSDFLIALNSHDIFRIVTSQDQFGDMLAANDLYFSVLIQGAACRRYGDAMPCRADLPIETRQALGACIRLILRENRRANLRQTSDQIAAFERIEHGGLISP